MELKFHNNKEAFYDVYLYFIAKETALKTYKRFKKIIVLILGLFISLSIVAFNFKTIKSNEGLTPEQILYIGSPIVIALIIVILSSLLSGVVARENFEDAYKKSVDENEEVTFKLDDKGIVILKEGKYKSYYWNGVKSVFERDEKIYIILNYDEFIVIPTEAFTEDIEFTKEELIEEIKNHI